MEACVREAYRIAQPGDVVLLSPACASWDMYTSFEQRKNTLKLMCRLWKGDGYNWKEQIIS